MAIFDLDFNLGLFHIILFFVQGKIPVILDSDIFKYFSTSLPIKSGLNFLLKLSFFFLTRKIRIKIEEMDKIRYKKNSIIISFLTIVVNY